MRAAPKGPERVDARLDHEATGFPLPLDEVLEAFGFSALREMLGVPGLFPVTSDGNKKRGRRKGQIGPESRAIRDAVLELTGEFSRMTVRQVFYALEVRGVVEKTESGYLKVQRQLLPMRREGLLRWDFITDGTRWQRKPNSWDSAAAYVDSMIRGYRRDLWQGQGVRLEVWLEKDALADLIVDVTTAWDVALMVSRGQSSATFLHSAAQTARKAWEDRGLITHIFTLYDHDAGGDRAARAVEEQLPEFAPEAPIRVARLAVTPSQISTWGLPTRPPKKTDPQAKAWGDKPAVELDAIPPDKLTQLVQAAIVDFVDERQWQVQSSIERDERDGLRRLREGLDRGDCATP
jgi:hypothetical protein